jgi:hypothetical protein
VNSAILTEAEIADKVIALVNWARVKYRIPEGSSAPAACEALRLGLSNGKTPTGSPGFLHEDSELIVIDFRVTNPGRREFTVFHEIVHYLLNQDGEMIEYFTEKLRNDDRAYRAAIERCCNLGAGEFLIPREKVRVAIREHGFSVELVARLAGDSSASIAAAATQLAFNAPVDCYVVVCFYDVSPRWPHALGLYAESAVRASGAFPIARGTMIPTDHLFHRVWDANRPLADDGYIPFASGKRFPCKHAEATRIGNQVVGILYCDQPPAKGQPRLFELL